MATESLLSLGRGPGSHWVRAHPPTFFADEDERGLTDPSPPAPPRSPKRASGPRFVEPCRFEASQRATLLTALMAEGLGDEDSRQIFLAALEYDLASCRPLMGEPLPPEVGIQPPGSPEAIGATAMATGPAGRPAPLVPPNPQAPDLKATALTGLALITSPPTVAESAPLIPASSAAPESAHLPPTSSAAPKSVHLTPTPYAAAEFAPLASSSSATTESAAPDSPLLVLAHLAADLAQALADLTLAQRETLKRALESSDCLARGYGDLYLDTLRLELLHLQAAFSASDLKPGMAAGTDPSSTIAAPINYPPSDSTNSSSPSLAPPVVTVGSSISDISPLVAAAPLASMANMPVPPPSPPPVPAEVRRFLRRAADAYADCFEGDPSLAADAPFPRILRVLADVTGLPLPKDELTLSEILVPGP